MAEETITTQYVREAPEIEARKLGLLTKAQELYDAGLTLPAVEAAGLSTTQQAAIDAAIASQGAYSPYIAAGASGITRGQELTEAGAQAGAGLDIGAAYTPAQTAMAQGLGQLAPMAQYASDAGLGMAAAGAGTGTMANAVGAMPQYMQADLSTANQYLGAAGQGIAAAGPSDFTGAAQQLTGATGTAGGATAGAGAAAQLGMQQMGQGVGALYQGAQQAAQAQRALGTTPQIGAAQVGIGGIQAAQAAGPQAITTKSFTDPGVAGQYMSPYIQSVLDEQMKELTRQENIAAQGRAAQAVKSGAFGGTRQGVQEAEAARNLLDIKRKAMAEGLQQAYSQGAQQFTQEQQQALAAQQSTQGAQVQTALANLNAEQQANVQNIANQLQAAGMNQQAAMQAALANQSTQAQMQQAMAQAGLQAAGMTQQAGQGQIAAGQQMGGLGMQAAAQQFQEAGFDATTAMQMAQLQQTQQQQALQQAAALQGLGGLYSQQALQQAQLGQAGATGLGQLGAQYAQLGLLPAQIAQAQAGIGAQAAGLYGTLGQGLGQLAQSQIGQGIDRAQLMGQLGTQQGQLGVQQAALGQTAQQMNQADIASLSQAGAIEQQNMQAQLDAARATATQTAMAPYQQLAFVSDIYKGAPSSQMSLTSQSAPSASPFQQVAGTITGGLTAAAAGAKAGLF